MNSIVERWIQSCRHELLDRTLIWNQAHLLHALHEYERFTTPVGPIGGSRTPDRRTRCRSRALIQTRSRTSTSVDATASVASSMSTNVPLDLHGRSFRHPQGRTPRRLRRRPRLRRAQRPNRLRHHRHLRTRRPLRSRPRTGSPRRRTPPLVSGHHTGRAAAV
jgi:hypothetical protein